LHKLGQDAEASADLTLALDIRPSFPEALLLLGSITATEGRVVDALRLYDRATVLQPSSFRAWYERGSLLYKHGQFNEAAQSWARAIECRPEDIRTRLNRAAALRKLNAESAALDEYRAVLQLDPNNTPATLQAAILLASSSHSEIRNLEAAEKLARIACEQTGFKDPQSLRVLAQTCRATQRTDEAAKWMALAQRIKPDARAVESTSRATANAAGVQNLRREARAEGATSRN
jgi:tetratricopeptide (TPR) repeat protein